VPSWQNLNPDKEHMTRSDLKSFYQQKASLHNGLLQAVRKKINLISNIRIASALIFLGVLFFGFRNHSLLYLLPVILLIFIVLVQRHSKFFEQRVYLENLLKVQQIELKALEGDITVLDNGAMFIETHHPFSHDLDIFGDGSLFQFINRSSTLSGKKLLASRLSTSLPTVDAIVDHQQAISELSEKTEFRHEIQASGMAVEELPGDRQQLREWVARPSFLFGNKFYSILLTVFPPVTIGLLVLSFFIDGVSPFFWLCAILQWGILGLHIKKINAFHQYISRKKNMLDRYASMLKHMQGEVFKSRLMKEISSTAEKADSKVASLASLVGALDARLNSMTTLFVNSLLLYDMQCVYRLEKWKEENVTSMEGWFDAIHEVEVLCSFGTFSFNDQKLNFPRINAERKLEAKELGHPLIAKDEMVVNDITLDENRSILIITGANMAGKSTFLRTLGVNVVLALSGSPVCASSFDCPLIEIRSGMRTADSLRDHQSYFYAELNRLKSIVDELKSGKKLLILLDEILKGTNSTDKQAGSIALVKQLVSYPSLVLVATHDLALGDLEKEYPQQIRNCCFEPTIENDQLYFDYKLKPGLATKMNATFLMKKMGIIPS
jgi:DNA mismatch repair ATPase MutS